MAERYELGDRPLILVQQRGKLALMILVCLGFVAVGAALLETQDPRPIFRAASIIIGAASIALFGWYAIVGAIGFASPARLTLEQAGLTLNSMLGERHWLWADIRNVQLATMASVDVVTFDSRSPAGVWKSVYAGTGLRARGGLPGGWPVGARGLFALLSEAKARWT